MRDRTKLKIGAAVAGILVLIALIVAGGMRSIYSGEALPGTEVDGFSVSGMSADEIRDYLAGEVRDMDRPLRVRTDAEALHIRPSTAGREVDIDATAERAVESGREGALGGVPATLAGLVASRQVGLAIGVNDAKLRRGVRALADRIDRPSFPGRLIFAADGGPTGIEPPRRGQETDRRKLAKRLRAALLDPMTTEITAPIERLDVVSPEAVDEVARKADRLLENPISIGQRRLERSEVSEILVLEPLDGSHAVRLGVRPKMVDELVASIAENHDRPAVDARVEAPSPPIVSEQGDLSWRPRPAAVTVRPARVGRAVDRRALAVSITHAVRREGRRVPLPTASVQPKVTTREARRVDHLIGTFTTYFDPGLPRVTNIQTMARTVNGTLVPAGKSFSLNGRVGQRTRAKGYVPAPMIADGKLVPSVGGGVSQFSTTIFNAAFFAGLQLDAYQPHSLYIERYPAGRESTLDYPSIDLAWTNDTDAPILVTAASDENSVTVSLYGDNGNRRVRSKSGPRRPVPDANFAIDVTRIIRFSDGRVDRSTRTTTYQNPID